MPPAFSTRLPRVLMLIQQTVLIGIVEFYQLAMTKFARWFLPMEFINGCDVAILSLGFQLKEFDVRHPPLNIDNNEVCVVDNSKTCDRTYL